MASSPFAVFMPQAAVNRGLSEVWRLIIPGWCGHFSPRWLPGWLASVSGLSAFWASVITTVPFSAVVVWQGRFWLLSFIPGGFLGMTLFFASGMNWTVTLLGFLAGNCVGIISEYGGQKLSEATTKRDGY
ncbi:DUF1097 domain-containing protein [Escherichia coli]|uniref:DUF1097 domain-containing protein n=1 Tax=Escherichia coli TaxID=562 RepID=UPI003F648147